MSPYRTNSLLLSSEWTFKVGGPSDLGLKTGSKAVQSENLMDFEGFLRFFDQLEYSDDARTLRTWTTHELHRLRAFQEHPTIFT